MLRAYTVRFMWAAFLMSLPNCGAVPAEGGDGGAGGAVTSGGGGGAETPTTGSAGGATTTTSSDPPACGEQAEPPGCTYPDPLLAFDTSKKVADVIAPIGVWEQNGASEGCVGPFADERTFSRVVIGFGTEMPPETMPIELRAVESFALSDRLPAFSDGMLDVAEPGPDGTTLGVYTVAVVTVPAGHVACVTTPLSAHWPLAMYHGPCRDPRRARWLGLPVDPGWVDLGESPPNKALSWAYLACPLDTTTDDGTPLVGKYERDLMYGVRE